MVIRLIILCDRMNLITKELTQLIVNGASRYGGFALADGHESRGVGKQLENTLAHWSKWYQLVMNRSMAKWAQLRNQLVIYGHTHLPNFACPGQMFSFNLGCGTCPDILTGLEIEDGFISQIAWTMDEMRGVKRHILAGPVPLQAYFD